ncbi:lysozyme-like [Trichoplusia ni]|uniref:Lysozyme n=1 Tax=Trichoplusia ni TaxID=7111 RepID=A0A7E5W538_TRINI|nr:lysozyme-like [Trichoplusia ni]
MWNARVVVFVLILIVNCVNCKRFETRCKLVRELLKIGMPNDMFLGQWVCLIEKSSNRETRTFTVKPSGKRFYGIYQIPQQWCRENKRGGGCNIACEDLLDDDIRDDTACAVQIAKLEGFKYWPQWTARCKNDYFITNEIYKCPDLIRMSTKRKMISSETASLPRYKRSFHSRRKRFVYRQIYKVNALAV